MVMTIIGKKSTFFPIFQCARSQTNTLRKGFKISANLIDMLKSSKTSSFLRTSNLEVPTISYLALADSLPNCDCFIRRFDCSFETTVLDNVSKRLVWPRIRIVFAFYVKKHACQSRSRSVNNVGSPFGVVGLANSILAGSTGRAAFKNAGCKQVR